MLKEENIIVIGASAGGLSAVNKLIGTFPEEIDAAIFIVIHLAKESRTEIMLRQIQQFTSLSCVIPKDGDAINVGTVYLAPADHHILIVKDKILISHGPYENHWRPAIDVLFRSAAASYGGCVTGIILTGMLDDGTSGMEAIQKSGGVTIVQDPEEAEFNDMPSNVLRQLNVDHILPIKSMAAVLIDRYAATECEIADIPEDVKFEAAITIRMGSNVEDLQKIATPSIFTCPDCGGALMKIKNEQSTRYRCYTGHSFSEQALDNAQQLELESSLWVAIRMMEERRNLLNSMENYNPIVKSERIQTLELHIGRLKEMLLKMGKPESKEK